MGIAMIVNKIRCVLVGSEAQDSRIARSTVQVEASLEFEKIIIIFGSPPILSIDFPFTEPSLRCGKNCAIICDTDATKDLFVLSLSVGLIVKTSLRIVTQIEGMSSRGIVFVVSALDYKRIGFPFTSLNKTIKIIEKFLYELKPL